FRWSPVLRQNRFGSLDGRPGLSDKLETRATGNEALRTPLHLRLQSYRPGREGRGTEDARRKRGTTRGGGRGRLAGAELCRASDVAVMQATNFGNRNDGAEFRRFNRPSIGGILVEREVSASPVIVREIRREETSQVPLAEDDDVIQALTPDRADESLRERILPRAVRGRENLSDPHTHHTSLEGVTVDCVAVAEEVGRRGIVGEGVHDLLGGPVSGGMLGHVEMDDPPAVVGEDNENEEHT